MSDTSVVDAELLTKYYGRTRGIEELSFRLEPGEVFGFLGPNGAGKSTTIRTMLDLIRPTSGRIRVFGLDPRADGPPHPPPPSARGSATSPVSSASTNGSPVASTSTRTPRSAVGSTGGRSTS
jgi:ABC-type Fe3+/spermidine/putrescine transport system ATPase subunit